MRTVFDETSKFSESCLHVMDAETDLALLDGAAGGASWLTVGRVLNALERRSRAAPSGSVWQDIVRERLEKAGHPISTGHLYKIRRAHQFLQECAPEAVNQEPPPKISSVEVAERLYRLDPEAGKRALHDVLGPKPVPYVDIKKRYEEALAAKPEMKSARHIAWDKRKPDVSGEELEGAGVSVGSGAPDDIREISRELAESVWGLASRKFQNQIEGLQEKVSALEEELESLKEDNRILQEEAESLALMVRELRGY